MNAVKNVVTSRALPSRHSSSSHENDDKQKHKTGDGGLSRAHGRSVPLREARVHSRCELDLVYHVGDGVSDGVEEQREATE